MRSRKALERTSKCESVRDGVKRRETRRNTVVGTGAPARWYSNNPKTAFRIALDLGPSPVRHDGASQGWAIFLR